MDKIKAKNLTTQLAHQQPYRASVNLPDPPASHYYQGLEFDFRNIWKYFFEGIELHEASFERHYVLNVQQNSLAQASGVEEFDILIEVDGRSIEVVYMSEGTIEQQSHSQSRAFANMLADIFERAGQPMRCTFESQSGAISIVTLQSRSLFDSAAVVNQEQTDLNTSTIKQHHSWQDKFGKKNCYGADDRPDDISIDKNRPGVVQKNRNKTSTYKSKLNTKELKGHAYDDATPPTDRDLLNWKMVLDFMVEGNDVD